ncbi:hypothetical protein EJ02DRAFT_26815 [Clathrospora elynae]|uniref:Uncharacterized protein n=1 Tax=Clathrospora elynae TaxID=706981 RepID=A0A6A5T0V6_9PLEO|nr:hypothetical protein EJ02DRAFT_26815 [Clathrospora elynae]
MHRWQNYAAEQHGRGVYMMMSTTISSRQATVPPCTPYINPRPALSLSSYHFSTHYCRGCSKTSSSAYMSTSFSAVSKILSDIRNDRCGSLLFCRFSENPSCSSLCSNVLFGYRFAVLVSCLVYDKKKPPGEAYEYGVCVCVCVCVCVFRKESP